MSLNGSARRRSSEMAEEQHRFDMSHHERERVRKNLRGTLTHGAADAWAAQALARARMGSLQSLGAPGEEVAFGRIDLTSTEETFYIGKHRIEADEIMVINWRARAAEP